MAIQGAIVLPEGATLAELAAHETAIQETVTIATKIEPDIAEHAQEDNDAQNAQNAQAQVLAKMHAVLEEEKRHSHMTEAERLLEAQFDAAKAKHQADAQEEERKRLEAQKHAHSAEGKLEAKELAEEAVEVIEPKLPEIHATFQAELDEQKRQDEQTQRLAQEHKAEDEAKHHAQEETLKKEEAEHKQEIFKFVPQGEGASFAHPGEVSEALKTKIEALNEAFEDDDKAPEHSQVASEAKGNVAAILTQFASQQKQAQEGPRRSKRLQELDEAKTSHSKPSIINDIQKAEREANARKKRRK